MRFVGNLKRAGLILGCILTIQVAQAQQDFLLQGFDNLPQANFVNPAYKPSSKGYLAMPGMNTYLGVTHSGFQLNHLLETRSQDDSLVLNPAAAISKMASVNYVPVNLSNELLGFGFSLGKSYFNFTVTNKTNFRFSYPKDLFRFAVEGNGASLLGERASLDGLAIDVMSYLETGVGYNRTFGEKLTVGAKLKYLVGWANVNTANSQLGIHTDATTFDITIDGQMAVNTSNVVPPNDSTSFEVNDILGMQNKGVGIDLGATFDITERISVSASVIDLGMINWKSNVNNFRSDSVNFTFQGVDINEFASDSSDVLETMTDSITGIFSYSENNESYNTLLPTRIYLGGTIGLTEKIEVGLNWYSEFYHARYRGAITASGSMQVTNWFRVGMNYTYYSRDFKNLGLGFAINGGPLQFYLMSDNVIGFISPQSSRNWHIRTGINFLFGRAKKEKETKASL